MDDFELDDTDAVPEAVTRARRAGARCAFAITVAAARTAADCGHARLIPGEAAHVIPGAEGAAFVETDGIRCSADVGAWPGQKELPESVAPVKVRIKNDSGQPIRLLYEEFVLVGASGHKYYAVPPLPLSADRQGQPPRVQPTYASTKFFVAPRFGDAYSTLIPWAEPLPRDEAIYRRHYKKWGDTPPDTVTVRAGLPEGVLADGGTISGFLYFENPMAREDRVSFRARLDRAQGGADADAGAAGRDGGGDDGPVASIKIPFEVQ